MCEIFASYHYFPTEDTICSIPVKPQLAICVFVDT